MAQLYPYQRRVYDALMAGRNVILQAPTGAGKTLAALYPFLENLDRYADDAYPAEAPLPLTCRYAVPMRVLATQFEREYHNYFPTMDRERGTRLMDTYVKRLGLKLPAIQTGETPDDPKFESPLTFCTIDQLLASFIGMPYSLGHRQANMNVGAVVGSYLVLDEFHLYPLDSGSGARMTTLTMLRLLKDCCRFVLMTATFSTHLLTQLGALLDAEVITVKSQPDDTIQGTDEDELTQIMAGRTRTLQRSPEPMSPEAILAAHEAARARGAGASLVVCNTVARAQDIYSRLKEALQERGQLANTRLELLHSRFTPEHRHEKSEKLEKWLGTEAWTNGKFRGDDTIIVATQVVEVGLNISVGVLHTEVAPANSLVQRAGRCARFAQQKGEVIVYPIPQSPNINTSEADDPQNLEVTADAKRNVERRKYLPYDRRLCEATWETLGSPADINGSFAPEQTFGWQQEQKLLDAVHTEEDAHMLLLLREGESATKRTIFELLTSFDRGKESELIRNVESVSVVIHPEPEAAITTEPFTWTSFQLHPDTLRGLWHRLRARELAPDLSWTMKQLVAVRESDLADAEEDSRRKSIYTWEPVSHQREIAGALCIALPPELALYDAELGFRLHGEDDEAGTWCSRQESKQQREHHQTKRDLRTYEQHITGLAQAYNASIRREIAWAANQLEQALSLPYQSVDLAIRLAIAFHDLGKLSTDWQRWTRDWQTALVTHESRLHFQVPPPAVFLAKTDMLDDWREEQALRSRLARRKPPSHACAGALVARDVVTRHLFSEFGNATLSDAQRNGGRDLLRAILSAIARHHTPTATTYDALAWDPACRAAITAALQACQLPAELAAVDLSSHPKGEVGEEWLTVPARESEPAIWLAFLIVRALRLSDQRAELDL